MLRDWRISEPITRGLRVGERAVTVGAMTGDDQLRLPEPLAGRAQAANLALLSTRLPRRALEQRLAAHVAVLSAHGVKDPFAGGVPLKVEPATLVMPGVVTPATAKWDALRRVTGVSVFSAAAGRPTVAAVDAKPLTGRALFSSPLAGRELTQGAYWVAPEISLPDNASVVFNAKVKHFIMITRRLVVGENVVIGWQPPQDNASALPPAGRPETPGEPSTGANGTKGQPGADGAAGRPGSDGPSFELWALEVVGSPWFCFAGQDGQDGQDSQDGGHGGPGGTGQAAEFNVTAVGVIDPFDPCKRRAGPGGDGGRGGDGGDGGPGGDGGDGGRVQVYALPDSIAALSRNFKVDVSPGPGGRGGHGGRGGNGGRGGSVGKSVTAAWPDTLVCGPAEGARSGNAGPPGREGDDGADGKPGQLPDQGGSLTSIDEQLFNDTLSQPLIADVTPAVVSPGQDITITGRNFGPSDRVLCSGVEAVNMTRVSDDQIVATLPDDLAVQVEIVVEQADGTQSTPYPVVQPATIDTVEQGDARRIRLGREVVIRGSGFGQEVQVFFDSVPAPDVVPVSANEIRCTAIRPFESPELTDADGERVRITVISRWSFGDVTSNPYEIELDTVRMLVLGTSLSWGQGLFPQEKAWARVRDDLRQRNGGIAVDVTVAAHSGAVIRASRPEHEQGSDQPVPGEYGGEVNNARPTIDEQLTNFLNGKPRDDTIDFVILDGGINDIQLTEILNPAGGNLHQLTQEHCYKSLLTLLQRILDVLPKASIVVTGYFQIVSSKTDITALGAALAALGFYQGFGSTILLGGIGAVPGALLPLVLTAGTHALISARCATFRLETDAALQQAVADAVMVAEAADSADGGRNRRIRFVSPDFREENAMLAPEAFLYGLDVDFAAQDPQEIAANRRAVCELYALDKATCPIASTGHPNPLGAKAYAEAIRRAVTEISDGIL